MSTTHITQLPSCLTSLLCTVGQNVFWSYIIILKYPGTCLKNFVVPQECNLKADAQNWAAQNWQNLRFSKIFLSYWTTILTFKCDFERFFSLLCLACPTLCATWHYTPCPDCRPEMSSEVIYTLHLQRRRAM